MQQISLLELNRLITQTLQEHLEQSYWVVAEISEIRLAQKGHCYLEVIEKEGDHITAKTRATIWSYTYRNLITWFENKTGDTLRPGLKILFNATVQYHEVFGLSLNIRDIDANFTLGEKARRKAETLEKLRAEGVFDMNRELSLPRVPQRVAVISSPTAAGWGDFMDQVNANPYQYRFSITLFQAMMQGAEASASIVAAMHQVFTRADEFDLLVVIRGGGATADLDCFDNYELASHVAQFPLPVITGIGHERDETVVDLVAHTRMKTPTAVAEFLVSGVRGFEEQILMAFERIVDTAHELIDENSIALERKGRNMHILVQRICTLNDRELDRKFQRLKYSVKQDIETGLQRLDQLSTLIKTLPGKAIRNQMVRFEALEKYLVAVHPNEVLKRGYSISRINGVALKNYPDEIKEGDTLVTQTDSLQIESTIKKFNKNY